MLSRKISADFYSCLFMTTLSNFGTLIIDPFVSRLTYLRLPSWKNAPKLFWASWKCFKAFVSESLFPTIFETVKKNSEKYLDPMFFLVHLHQACDGSSNICTASFQRFSTKHSLKMTSPCIFTFCVSDISGYRSCIYLNRGSTLWREIFAFD